jgi:integrase
MKHHPNLVRRRGIFYFRIRVPAALVVKVGRKELWRSLRTGTQNLARLRAWALAGRLQQLWAALRQAVDKGQIDQLVAGWLTEALAQDAASRADNSFAVDWTVPGEDVNATAARMLFGEAEASLIEWREALNQADWAKAIPTVNVLLRRHGIALASDSEPYRLLCLGICVATAELQGIRLQRSEGRWGRTEHLQLFGSATATGSTNEASRATPAGPPLKEAIDSFLKEKERRESLTPKRRMDFEAALKLLSRQLGEARPVDRVTRAEIGGLRMLLGKLPPNFTKRFPGRSLEEIAADSERLSLRTLNTGTINQKYLALFEAFFQWCIACGYMTENPALGVRVTTTSTVSPTGRGTFKLEELKTIFSAPIFVGCRSESRIYQPGSCHIRDYRYWLPILGLLTGARLGELCQLLNNDVREIDGVVCIDITAEGGKTVKSEAGKRQVPLHPELRRLGFVRHVEQMRAAGVHRLFPNLEVGKSGYLSDNASKWFARFLQQTLGKETVEARRLVYHSFRHGMKDALRAAGVEERIQDALIGHETDHVSSVYGEGYKPPRLYEEISKVRFLGLDLSHLYDAVPGSTLLPSHPQEAG